MMKTPMALAAVLAISQLTCSTTAIESQAAQELTGEQPRSRVSLDDGWRFTRGDPAGMTTSLGYADVKQWVLPTGNAFVVDPARRAQRPEGNLGGDVAYTSP